MDKLTSILENEEMLKVIFNCVFYFIIGIPILVQLINGITKGFKKTMWKMIIYLCYMVVFFITLNSVCDFIFTMNLFGIPDMIGTTITGTSYGCESLKDLSSVLKDYLIHSSGSSLGEAAASAEEALKSSAYVAALFDGLFVYIIKAIWSLIYFIILVPIFCILTRLLIFNVFIKGKEEMNRINKDPFLGFITGGIFGLMKAFVLMIYLGGFLSILSYTGEIESAVETISNIESSETTNASEDVNQESDVLNLSNNYQVELASDVNDTVSSISSAAKTVKQVINVIKIMNNAWDNNMIVSLADNIYFKEQSETAVDGSSESTNVSILDKCFDEVIYFKYEVDGDSEDSENLTIKVNFIEDLNNIIQAALYILDDDSLFETKSDGSLCINLANLSSAKVETAFNYLSDCKFVKVILTVGLNIVIESYQDKLTGIVDLTDKDFQNELYSTDFIHDLSTLGKFIGGLIDLGLGKFLSDYINSEDKTLELDDYLKIFIPEQGENETTEAYNTRVETARKKVTDNISNLYIVKIGGKIVSGYVVDSLLENYLTELGFDINSNDLNKKTSDEIQTYRNKLLSTIDLGSDLGLIFEIIFDCSDFVKDGKFDDIMDVFSKVESSDDNENTEEKEINYDSVAECVNILLADLSEISFLQATMDIAVNVLITKIDKENIKKYLTSENIFKEYIDWEEEIGGTETTKGKIPNLVEALITCKAIDLITNGENIAEQIFNLESIESVFADTITALFDLQLLSNLEQTCLTPLLQELISSMAGDSLTVKISDKLGQEGHRYKDEILSFISIFDDLLQGAKDNGCEKFDDLFSDLTNIIKGIGNVDINKLVDSAILGPTMAYLLSTLDNDTLVVPYVYEDEAWFSNGDDKGELYYVLDAIKGLVDNDALVSLISGEKVLDEDGNEKSTLDLITEFNDSELEKLFKSTIIKATVTNLLDSFSTDDFKIIVPSTAKELVVISKYSEDDKTDGKVTVLNDSAHTITLEEKDESGNNKTVQQANIMYISSSEFTNVIRAIHQIGSLEDLMGGTLDTNIIKNFDGEAVDGLSHDNGEDYSQWCYTDQTKTTRRTKIDVIFSSEVLRCTLSHYLTGDNYESEYFVFPYDEDNAEDTIMELVDGSYYVTKKSIMKLFDSIFTLLNKTNLDDLSNIGDDIVDKILNLSSDDIDKLFDSEILAATFSNVIAKVEALSIPVVDGRVEETEVLPIVNNEPSTKYLVKGEEFKALMNSFKICFPEGLDLSSDFDVNEILDSLLELGYLSNKGLNTRIDEFFDSVIFSATLSKYITSVDSLIVPYIDDETVEDYTKLVYNSESETYSTTTSYKLTVAEEKKIIKSLEKLFPYKKGGLGDNELSSIDYTSLISNIITLDDGGLTTLFDSSILSATIGDALMGTSGSLVVPFNNDTITQATRLKYNSGNDAYTTNETQYIVDGDSLADLILSLGLIFKDNVDINNISSDIISDILKLSSSDLNTLFASDILRATISKTLYEQSAIEIPKIVYETPNVNISLLSAKIYKDNDNYVTNENCYIITKDECVALIQSFKLLFGDSIDFSSIGFDTFKNLSRLNDDDINTLVGSYILDATISNKLTDAFSGSSTEIIIPSNVVTKYDNNNTSSIYMVDKTELINLIKAMGYFDFDTFGGSDSFSAFKTLTNLTNIKKNQTEYYTQIELILNSKVLHATMSEILLSMTTGSMSLAIPDTVEDTTLVATKLDTDKTISTEDVLFIKDSEISALLNAINYIDINGFGSGNNVFNELKGLLDYTHLNEPTKKIDKVFESEILKATISNYVFKMDGSSIEIIVPKTALETTKVDNLASGSQTELYVFKGSELTNFITALSYLDIDALGGSDIGNTVKALSANITSITNSEILSASLGRYLIENLSNMGFSGLVIPQASISNLDIVKLSSNVFADDDINVISKQEMINFINALTYIDLNGIASDTLNTIAELNNSANDNSNPSLKKIDKVFESGIMKYTLSAQIVEFASTSSIIIPNEVISSNQAVYDAALDNTNGQKDIVNYQDIVDLINVLELIDLEHIDVASLMNMSEVNLTRLFESKIITANASDKFVAALGSNTQSVGTMQIKDFVSQPKLYDTTLTYGTGSNTKNVLKQQEFIDIFNSMKVIGTNDLANFSVGLETINALTDNGRNEITTAPGTYDDDDRNDDVNDNRAKFLRSLFIRSLIATITSTSNDPDDVDEPLVSDVTYSIEQLYSYTLTIKNAADDYAITLNNTTGKLTWNEAKLYNGSTEYTAHTYTINYSVIINGTEYLANTNELDIHTYLTDYKEYSIKVRAQIVIPSASDTLGTAQYLLIIDANDDKLIKPKQYSELNQVMKYTTEVITTKEDIATVTDSTSITNNIIDNNKITFTTVANADKYTIVIKDTTPNIIKTIVISNSEAGNTVNVDLGNDMEPGSYTYTIKAESSSLSALYNSSTTTSTSFKVVKTLDEPKLEIISINNINYLYISSLGSFNSGAEIKIDSESPVSTTTYDTITTADGDIYVYTYVIPNTLANGTHTFTVKPTILPALDACYSGTQTSINFDVINAIDDTTIKLSNDNQNIEIGKVSADKYQINVYRIEGDEEYLQLYKEIQIDANDVLISTSNLFKGYKYRVEVTPINTSGAYISSTVSKEISYTRALNPITGHEIDDDLYLTISGGDTASTYEVYLYECGDTDTELGHATYDQTKTVIEMFNGQSITFNPSKTYKIKVKSIGSGLYTDSILSTGKKFTLTQMDRVYDLSYDDATNSISFTDVDTASDSYTYKVVIKKEVNDAYTELQTLTFSKNESSGILAYTENEEVITINLSLFDLLEEEESGSYKVYVYTEAISDSYKESRSSVGVRLYK